MRRSEINELLRTFARTQLSPSVDERELVTRLHAALRPVLENSCLLVGSFARFTAIHPLHDLDILYIQPATSPERRNPGAVLSALESRIRNEFANPTRYQFDVSKQSHSVTISLSEGGEEVFAVDVVPAYISEQKNEFGDDVYDVPEIARVNRRRRVALYERAALGKATIGWIRSDPRGYIRVAQSLNDQNDDFRKAVKIVKRWKHACCDQSDAFKLKSFHVEQVITEAFRENPRLDIFGAVFKFFVEIGDVLFPHIPDRADASRLIDDYVRDLVGDERQLVFRGRDATMIHLESLEGSGNIAGALHGRFYQRCCQEEAYLFDQGIPVFLDGSRVLRIDGRVLPKPGFREYWLSEKQGRVGQERRVHFEVVRDGTGCSLKKWKVKNCDDCPQPRGEITDEHTRVDPESTKYIGQHYVECYAIENGACVAKARQNVIIE